MPLRVLVVLFSCMLFAAPVSADPPANPGASSAAAAVRAALPALDQQIAALADRVQQARRLHADVEVPDATLATAELFRRWIESDARDPQFERVALDELTELRPLLGPALAAARRAVENPAAHPEIESPDARQAVMRRGGWYVGDRPVFLTAYMMLDAGRYPFVRRLGGNMVGVHLPTSRLLAAREGFNESALDEVIANLNEADRLGLRANLMFHPGVPRLYANKNPESVAATGHFCNFDISDAKAVASVASAMRHTAARLAPRWPGMIYDLWNEAAFTEFSPAAKRQFRDDLRARYGSIARLNAAWGTQAADFQSITPESAAKHPAAFNDLCRWNERRVTAAIRAYADAVRQGDPKAVTHVKVMNEACLTAKSRGGVLRSRYLEGIDRDAVAEACELHGCDTRPILGDPEYAFHWTLTAMCYDLQRSLDPAKPIFDSEWHQVCTTAFRQAHQPAGAMRAALWMSRLHGMDACEIWGWLRKGDAPSGEFFEDSLLTQPQLLNAYAGESIRIQRLAPEVVAFQDQEPEVRLLLSRTSATMDPRHLLSLRASYEALTWQGVAVGFATEPMLEAGRGRAKVLLVPAARNTPGAVRDRLREWAAGGVRIVLLGGECLSRDEMDRPTPVAGLSGAVRWTELPDRATLSRFLDDAGVTRPVRCVDESGGAPVGVAFQSVSVGGRRLGYVLGLGKGPVTVRLTANGQGVRRRSLITGEVHEGAWTVRPFDVDLFEIR